jgi:YVTN family beta-propeller protein
MRRLVRMAIIVPVVLVAACTTAAHITSPHSTTPSATAPSGIAPSGTGASPTSTPIVASTLLPGMPAPLSATNVYAADTPNNFSPAVRGARALVYVPNSASNTVSVIDQHTMTVIGTFPVGAQPQHVVPSYDLKTLYVAADNAANADGGPVGSLTPINPITGAPGTPIPVDDPYNLYFTPDGKFAIVVAEAHKTLEFYNPHTWKLEHSLAIPSCGGIDHIDFNAAGTMMLASCEFSDAVVAVNVEKQTVIKTVTLPLRADGMPQDVKLSPDGKVFYVADMMANGVYIIDSTTLNVIGFLPTGHGAHGLYIDRTGTRMFVTNRLEGSISVVDLATRSVTAKWIIPGGGSPDMGNLSADGTIFWISGRYNGVVYAISTVDGHLIKKIAVGAGPHGLCVWPQPGRYSLGHTGILR